MTGRTSADQQFPAVRPPAPMAPEAGAICEVIGAAFADWRVWWHADIYYARRRGRYLHMQGAPDVYAVWHANPVVLLTLLEAQDRLRPPGRWDPSDRPGDRPGLSIHAAR
jgi:hypothetical protein